MPHPLQRRIADVGRRAWRLVIWHGLGRVVAIGVAVLLLLALADYLIRFRDPGIRIIASTAALASIVAAVWRFLYVPLRGWLSTAEVARRVEQRFPQLGERLSSAVEFLGQPEDDPAAGSATLRRAVVNATEVEAADLDFDEALNLQPARGALATAAALLLVAGLLTLLSPAAARIAALRLANPLGSTTWPRHHALKLVEAPTRLAAGQPFEVEVVDRHGRLPDTVQMHYRYLVADEAGNDGAAGDGRPEDGISGDRISEKRALENASWGDEQRETLTYRGGPLVARRDTVARPFQYRATGGDDDTMAWVTLDVVEPPRIESLEITLHPPPYTGYGPYRSEKRIRALRGTRVEIRGTSSKPLRAARLELGDAAEVAADIVPSSAGGAEASAPGHRFAIPPERLVVEESGPYKLVLIDAEGLAGGDGAGWEIRALPDAPPSVALEQPATNLFVTPDALLPLQVLVKDDLAIRDVTLHYTRSDRSDEGETDLVLYRGPPQVVAAAAGSPLGEAGMGESRLLEHAWDLAPLALPPGTQLTLVVGATDYVPQTGQSHATRRVTIITPGELEDRLAQRQAFILGELARALQMQREVRARTDGVRIELVEVGRLADGRRDALQAAELNQRQVTRTLTDPQEGVPVEIDRLLADLASNKLDSPGIARRMETLRDELRRLADDPLPEIGRTLTSALKTAQRHAALVEGADPAPAIDPAATKSLESAVAGQDEVIATLERLLGELSEWAGYRRFARDARQLLREQENLADATRRVGGRGVGRDLADLPPQQRAELRKLAAGQAAVARRLDKLTQGMERSRQVLGENEPLAAATLDDAIHYITSQGVTSQGKQPGSASQGGLAGAMRTASGHLAENRVGQATRQQAAAAAGLQELLDILSGRREHELERLVAKLREAENDLDQLRREQQGLRKKLEAARDLAKPGDQAAEQQQRRALQRLARAQEQVQKEIERMARRLKRLEADRAGRSAERAAKALEGTCSACRGGDAGAACRGAKAAEKDLDEAQQQLAEARRQAEADLAREQLARFDDALRGMIDRQQRLFEETLQLHARRTAAGRLTPAEAHDLAGSARAQELLAEEAAAHAERMKSARAFALALSGAADAMRQAATQLAARATGPTVQQPQQRALARLTQLAAALADDELPPGDDPQGGGGAGGGGQGGGQKIRDLAELKLVKLMQDDLRARTAELDAARDAGSEPGPEERAKYDALAREQGKLAELLLDMVAPSDAPVEEDPERLPELDLDDLPPLDLDGGATQ